VQRLQRQLNGVADAAWILENLLCPSASMNRVQLPRKAKEQVYNHVNQCQDIRVAAGQVKSVHFVDLVADPTLPVTVDQMFNMVGSLRRSAGRGRGHLRGRNVQRRQHRPEPCGVVSVVTIQIRSTGITFVPTRIQRRAGSCMLRSRRHHVDAHMCC